jgi:hypothetical protein
MNQQAKQPTNYGAQGPFVAIFFFRNLSLQAKACFQQFKF